jgi:hypothetical protein
MKPQMEASMYSDLLNAALSEVDWLEMAEQYVNEFMDEDEEGEEEEEEVEP